MRGDRTVDELTPTQKEEIRTLYLRHRLSCKNIAKVLKYVKHDYVVRSVLVAEGVPLRGGRGSGQAKW